MSIQTAQEVDIRLGEETVFGQVPAVPALTTLEKVSWSLSLKKDSYVSNRMRADRQIAFMRHGVRSVDGDLTDELAIGSHDRLLAGAFAGEWEPGIEVAAPMAVAGSVITRATGSFVTDGILVGDVVGLTGFTEFANANIHKVLSVAPQSLVLSGSLADEPESATAKVVVTGFKLKNGKTKHSYFAEVSKPDIDGDNFEVFTGLRVGSANISLPPTGLATIRYAFMGQDMKLSDIPLDDAVEAATTGDLLCSVNGSCLVDGVEAALLTALDVTIDNGLSGEAVVGRNTKPALLYGKSKVTGSFSASTLR